MDTEEITVEDADKLLLEGSNKPKEVVVEKAPEAVEETKEVEQVETPVVEETPAEEDWLAQVPDAVKDRVKEHVDKLAAAEQRIRSDDGRVRAFQRQAEELKRKLESMQRVKPQESPAAELPSTPEEWQQVVDHDPVLAKAIEARVKAEIQEFKKANLDPMVKRQVTSDELRELEQTAFETARLEELIPGAQDIYASPMFQGWLEHEAPPYIQRIVHESKDHRDYVAVFKNFAIDMINTGRMPAELEQAAPAAANSIDPKKAQDIADSRAKRLAQPAVGSKQNFTPPPSTSSKEYTMDEAEALLKAAWDSRKS